MNGRAATRVVLGYGGCKPPFTAVQWQELEKQTMIYKYLMAGLPVPPHLLPISALACLSYSYYGKKLDPEPQRCRRSDGKKWRCSKAAYSDSKYCERHMYRSRTNRSRKLVESQPTSTACSHHMPDESSFWSNVTKLQMGPHHNTQSSFFMPTPDPHELSSSHEASKLVGSLGLCSTSTSSIQESFSSLQGNSSTKQYLAGGVEPVDASFSNQQQQQHNFFGSDAAAVKQGQNPVHLFFCEWPATRESWCNLDYDRSDHNISSSTHLSISIPTHLPLGIAYSKNDASS